MDILMHNSKYLRQENSTVSDPKRIVVMVVFSGVFCRSVKTATVML